MEIVKDYCKLFKIEKFIFLSRIRKNGKQQYKKF
jgi:hypothetical protein